MKKIALSVDALQVESFPTTMNRAALNAHADAASHFGSGCRTCYPCLPTV